MRLREIIKETEEKLQTDALDAIPGALRWDGLDNSSPYHAYRFGVALAGMPDYMMPLDGPVGQKMVTIGYTEADDEILKATGKNLGFSGVVLTPRGSTELPDTNVQCPVNNWNKSTEKKNVKEGVMQTGDPGMGTPEANKAGWGSGNYTSQRTGSWNGTSECMGDDLDQEWSKKMKLLKKVNRHNKNVKENTTSGITSSGNVTTLGINPSLSPGSARGNTSYTGTPGRSGRKSPPQPKPKKQKPTDNALNMKNVSIFGQPIKR
jgi:hypothetical protein